MVNITHKSNTLRKAIATATVSVSQSATIEAIKNKTVPKGDVFEFARAAGLLSIKKTSDLIPDCHPLPIEFAAITYSINELNIIIQVEVHTIYKTGVEVEAMHGASLTALTIYDMLKPLDKQVEINSIKLISKTGGKSDFKNANLASLNVAIIVCSDTVSAGTTADRSGKTIQEKLNCFGLESTIFIVPDDIEIIQNKARELISSTYNLLLFTGGTGVSKRDCTPEAISPLIDMHLPGIVETARQYGQQRTSYAMLSRSVAGFSGDSLLITMPGSPSGAAETLDAIFPAVIHAFTVREGNRHE